MKHLSKIIFLYNILFFNILASSRFQGDDFSQQSRLHGDIIMPQPPIVPDNDLVMSQPENLSVPKNFSSYNNDDGYIFIFTIIL